MPSRPVALLSESLSSSSKTLVEQIGAIVNTLSVQGTYLWNDFIVSSDSIDSTSLEPTSEKCLLKASEICELSVSVFRPISKVFTKLSLDFLPHTSFIVLHSFLGLFLLIMQASL